MHNVSLLPNWSVYYSGLNNVCGVVYFYIYKGSGRAEELMCERVI